MIEQIKLALASSTPVVIGFYVRRGFGELTPTNQVDYDINTPLDGGHAVVALGYDKEGLIVENSWGTYWGNKGFGKLSWAVVAKDVFQRSRGLLTPNDHVPYGALTNKSEI